MKLKGDTFVNKEESDIFKQLELAKTLKVIAQKGVDAFYNGSVGLKLVEDLKEFGRQLSYMRFKDALRRSSFFIYSKID